VDAHYYLWLTTKTQAQEEYQKLFAMAPDYYRVHQLALLILDPLVRLHAIDENAAGEMAAYGTPH
jgi:hypothetical protein